MSWATAILGASFLIVNSGMSCAVVAVQHRGT